jgi:DHA2 family multidrug resistance protein
MAKAETSTPSSTMVPIDTQAPHYKWLVAAIVLLAALTQTFAGNSVNLVIPRLMATFGADLAAAQWITTGFLITRTLIIPILGWLGGFLGNRNLFVACLVGFIISSTGCGLAPNLGVLVGFRLLQGLTIGSMEGLSAVILLQTFPLHQRGLALGLRNIGSSVGHVISFTLGGYFIEEVSWRLIFFLGLPSGIIAAVLGLLLLPQQREYRGEPVDYTGLLFLGAFLIPLLLVISFGRNSETAFSTLVLLGFAATIGGSCFILRELLGPFPAVNLRLFRSGPFCLLCTTALFNNIGMDGAQFMIPIFLQQVMGFSPLQAGLIITPAIIVSGFSGVLSGRLSDLIHPSLVVLGSLVTLIAVFYAFSSVTALTAVGVLVIYIMLYRIGMFATTTPITALNAQILGMEQIRMGQGLMGVVRNIGAGIGVTTASVVFERRRAEHQLMAYAAYDPTTPTHQDTLGELKHVLHQAGMVGDSADQAALRTIQQQLDTEAVASGFRESFFFMSLCFVIASVPMVWGLYQRRRFGSGYSMTPSVRN